MRIRVLIADDHAIVTEGLRHVIAEQSDLTVVDTVEDGRAALQRVIDLVPDVVVMDIAMPGMNGIEATRAIRERSPRTRVIVLSMHSNPEYVYRALRAGASGFIVKRSAARELVEAIRSVHAGRGHFSSVIRRKLARGAGAPPDPLAVLSGREREVLQLLAEGKGVAEIAELLHLSPKTIETHRAHLYEKLDIHDLPGLVRFAIQHGVIPLGQ